MSKYALTAARLRELVDYDPETGAMTWRATGKPAGSRHSRGYWQISIDGRKYLRHHLAFLYVLGRWATVEIDHINGDKTDDRIDNLREATRTQNSWNKGLTARNKSGLKGASWDSHNRRWRGQINVGGKMAYLGSFQTPEEAHAAYVEAARKLHGEFLRLA
jgi:hypothetical protein